jgi:antitoxin CptB
MGNGLDIQESYAMSGEELAMRRRRALYRAQHRGSKELDLLLGRFAADVLGAMTDDEVAMLEHLLSQSDPDIADSFYQGTSLGEPGLDELMHALRHFHGLKEGQ